MKTFAQVRDAIIETYDAAEEHLDKANAAHQGGKLGEYHRHMTNFHDAMSEWHDDRGRSGSSDKHSRLADEHDDKARELGEEFVVTEDVTDHKYEPHDNATMKTSKGHTHAGVSYNSSGNKGANILIDIGARGHWIFAKVRNLSGWVLKTNLRLKSKSPPIRSLSHM